MKELYQVAVCYREGLLGLTQTLERWAEKRTGVKVRLSRSDYTVRVTFDDVNHGEELEAFLDNILESEYQTWWE